MICTLPPQPPTHKQRSPFLLPAPAPAARGPRREQKVGQRDALLHDLQCPRGAHPAVRMRMCVWMVVVFG